MSAEVHYFGIRHHGPGSARRLAEALAELAPVSVLIEGPADASELLPMLADPAMVAPVALLSYPLDDPGQAVFWPFAAFSPEYQAVCWAVGAGAAVRFIDLPTGWRTEKASPEDTPPEDETSNAAAGPNPDTALYRDPLGTLAKAAGYEDGESWWRDVIEENPSPGPIFSTVGEAMAALRQDLPLESRFEAQREAHMRLEIAKERKATEGPIAVVCGAWHVPALQARHAAKDDRALLKGAPKRKTAATWAPWTAPRLAIASGYGAGVTAPGWCRHLWETPSEAVTTRWIARTGRRLREDGHTVSTASLIEAERLAKALAALRDRPQPGFEEMREAAIACLCHGNALLWETVARDLLIGSEVGEIPDGVPLAPLLEDLKRQQKATRLKPDALEKELSLDLRSESGLTRSTLLHRLAALGVGWGRPGDSRSSRGTFRERWLLAWEPEHAVALVENLIYGATIEQAAAGRLGARMAEAASLADLADLTFTAMTAQLKVATAEGIRLLTERAALTDEGPEMLAALPPLADAVRYGRARAVDGAQLAALFERIAVQGALALPHACRALDAEAAALRGAQLCAADAALRLIGENATLTPWQDALERVVDDTQATALLAGTAARLLYESEAMASEAAVALLSRRLSPATPAPEAAAFFAGFFEGAGQRLLFDDGLRGALDTWLTGLDPETFTEHLPLFRRVFSGLDKTERRRLLDTLLGRRGALEGFVPAPDAEVLWARHVERLTPILSRGDAHG